MTRARKKIGTAINDIILIVYSDKAMIHVCNFFNKLGQGPSYSEMSCSTVRMGENWEIRISYKYTARNQWNTSSDRRARIRDAFKDTNFGYHVAYSKGTWKAVEHAGDRSS